MLLVSGLWVLGSIRFGSGLAAIDSRGTFPAATRPQSLPAVGDRFCKFSSLSTACWLILVCCAKCS